MYKIIEKTQRMDYTEASEHYPDSFIIMSMDNITSDMGTVLYIGDNRREIYSLLGQLKDTPFCGVIEGINHQQSLGGVFVGE